MPTYLGRGGAIGIGFESTAGTPVSRTVWCRLVEVRDPTPQVEVTNRELMGGPDDLTGGMALGTYHGDRTHGPTVIIEADYANGFVGLLYAALGAGSSTSDGAPETHSLQPANDHIPLTLEVIRAAQTDGTDRMILYAGAVITSMRITASPGQYVRAEITFAAMSAAAETTGGAPSFGAVAAPLRRSQVSSIAWNSLTHQWRDFTIAIENETETRRNVGSDDPAGFALLRRTITVQAEIEEVDATLAAWLAATASNLVITFTGASNNELVATLYSAPITAYAPGSSRGVSTASVTWQGIPTPGTNRGCLIDVTNENASYTTNG
jgi:hypothetical protein